MEVTHMLSKISFFTLGLIVSAAFADTSWECSGKCGSTSSTGSKINSFSLSKTPFGKGATMEEAYKNAVAECGTPKGSESFNLLQDIRFQKNNLELSFRVATPIEACVQNGVVERVVIQPEGNSESGRSNGKYSPGSEKSDRGLSPEALADGSHTYK
jgi:hypothetical protein